MLNIVPLLLTWHLKWLSVDGTVPACLVLALSIRLWIVWWRPSLCLCVLCCLFYSHTCKFNGKWLWALPPVFTNRSIVPMSCPILESSLLCTNIIDLMHVALCCRTLQNSPISIHMQWIKVVVLLSRNKVITTSHVRPQCAHPRILAGADLYEQGKSASVKHAYCNIGMQVIWGIE